MCNRKNAETTAVAADGFTRRDPSLISQSLLQIDGSLLLGSERQHFFPNKSFSTSIVEHGVGPAAASATCSSIPASSAVCPRRRPCLAVRSNPCLQYGDEEFLYGRSSPTCVKTSVVVTMIHPSPSRPIDRTFPAPGSTVPRLAI